MDTWTHKEPGQQVDVNALIEVIKNQMPQTYQSIKDKANESGKEAYALVRRGLKGEANCFWAMEAGHVMGTPFNLVGIGADIAHLMCQFGCRHVVMWATPAQAAPVATPTAQQGA